MGFPAQPHPSPTRDPRPLRAPDRSRRVPPGLAFADDPLRFPGAALNAVGGQPGWRLRGPGGRLLCDEPDRARARLSDLDDNFSRAQPPVAAGPRFRVGTARLLTHIRSVVRTQIRKGRCPAGYGPD